MEIRQRKYTYLNTFFFSLKYHTYINKTPRHIQQVLKSSSPKYLSAVGIEPTTLRNRQTCWPLHQRARQNITPSVSTKYWDITWNTLTSMHAKFHYHWTTSFQVIAKICPNTTSNGCTEKLPDFTSVVVLWSRRSFGSWLRTN